MPKVAGLGQKNKHSCAGQLSTSPASFAGQKSGAAKLRGSAVLVQIPEIHRHQATYAGLLHGNAIDHIYRTHGHLIMRNNDEL